MATLATLINRMWWLVLAAAPGALWRGVDQVLLEIGCPARGDCYQPGWLAAFNLDLWVLALAALVWPACAWNLGLRWPAYRVFGMNRQASLRAPVPEEGAGGN